jgi:hypothetical protein
LPDLSIYGIAGTRAFSVRCLDRPATRKELALKAKADNETLAEVIRKIARINRL